MHWSAYKISAIAMILSACGAPAKSASSVSSIFSESRTLQGVASDLCSNLESSTEAPSVQNFRMKIQGCQRVGEGALDYTKIKAFGFVNLDGTTTEPSSSSADAKNDKPRSGDNPPTISKQNRAQLWLNKSLLDMAKTLTTYMKQNASTGVGEIKLPNSAGSELANLAKLSVNLLEKPALDIEKLSFSMKLKIAITGIVKVTQTINVDGKLINNAFALTIKSAQDMPYAQSLIKNLEIVVLVIPFANDIYLDMFSNVEAYDMGVKAILSSQLDSFWSTGLKGIIDSVVLVKGESK